MPGVVIPGATATTPYSPIGYAPSLAQIAQRQEAAGALVRCWPRGRVIVVGSGDVTPPVVTLVSETRTRISRVVGVPVTPLSVDNFEVGLGGWFEFVSGSVGAHSVGVSATWAAGGVQSMRVQATAITNGSWYEARNSFMPIDPSNTVTLTGTVNVVTLGAGMTVQPLLAFSNEAGAFITQAAQTIATTGVTAVNLSFTAPAGAYQVRAILRLVGAPVTGAADAYFDNITVAAALPADSTDVIFSIDEAYQQYQVRVVPGTGSPNTAGTLLEAGGAGAAGTITVNITDDELVAAGGTEGVNVIKIFAQDTAGNWSA